MSYTALGLFTVTVIWCHVLCLQHGIPVWHCIGQSITATSRHRRDMTTDVTGWEPQLILLYSIM